MKKFWNNNRFIIAIALSLVVIFAIGGIYSNHMIEHRAEELAVDETRYYDAVVLVDLQYNFDIDTLGQKTYIATFTYENNTYEVYLDNTFTYVEMLSGDPLDLIVMSAVKHHAETEEILQNVAYIASYDNTSRTVVIDTEGFHGVISLEITLNATLDGISNYTVTSHETYNSEYNSFYSGGPVPEIENYVLNQYISNSAIDVDAVAGASEGTLTAMEAATALLTLFMTSLQGGA